ncbi:MAG: hypothetical protein FVQ81_18180 [Candidatus Glassbacteria bacterium]|nr:hypothetical protein [Candidatus Glassbacteria bacterium]
MKRSMVALTGLAFAIVAACSGGSRELETPQQRTDALSAAVLKMIRAEHMAMAGELEMDAEEIAADSAFHRAVRLDPECVEDWVQTGESLCGEQLLSFLEASGKLDEFAESGQPASVVREVLSKAPESADRVGAGFDGYAAAFQLCLEVERDGTLMQDFLPFLVAVGCPLTLSDLGLEEIRAGRLNELAAEAAGLTGRMPYPAGQEHYFITFIKLNNWAGKFSGQVTADTLAAELLSTEGSERVIGHLRNKGTMTVGFLGDSHMDGIHWSTQAPFPDIVRGVFRRINARVRVVNAGKGGDDSGEALERIDEDLIAKRPDITFVILGGNDARHWGGPAPAVTPGQYRRNMIEIVTRLREAGSRVVLMGYPLSPTRKGADLDVFLALREQLRSVADSLGTGFLDIAKVLDAEPAELVFAVDMIHFDPATHMKIAGMVLARLAAMDSPDQLK